MKRFIACMLCTLLLVGALAAPAFAAFNNSGRYESGAELKKVDTFTLGDLDDDGSVALKDLLAIRKHIVDKTVEINTSAADAIADGKVNTRDLLAMRKHFGNVEKLSKYESDAIVNKFTIAGNDITEYCIIVPEGTKDTNDVYGNAASLFRRFVHKATDGYALDIDQKMTAGKSHAIRFVAVDEKSELGQKLEIENYIYEVENGDLVIYSTRRGALHAIYDILEDYLGFRFFNNYITHEYETRYVDIPEGTYVFVDPILDFRHCSQSFGSTNVGDHRHPRHLNGSQGGSSDLKWGTQTGPEFINAHSYGYYWKMGTGYANWDTAGQVDRENASASQIKKADLLYAEKYNSGHQQDELNWNPCFVSDDAYEVLFRGLLETIRYMHTWREFRFPTSSMSFSICDSPFLCSCTECRYLSKTGTMEISIYGQAQPDIVECLGGGGAAQCLYLANRGAKDIQKYYEGRPASDEWYYDEDEGWDETMPYGMPLYDEYPGLSLYTIFYDHALPLDYENLPEQDSLHPFLKYSINMDYIPLDEHIIIMFCGTACNNHYVGTKDCNGSLNVLGGDPDHDVDALVAWGQACKDVGAQMWYWYYPVTYCSHIVDAPNITNIYHDIKFLVEHCNVNGVYYEGTSQDTYQFEFLKAHLASIIMYEMSYDEEGNMTIMSEEEFHEAIKEYLYLYYGDGYEYVYQYLLMYEEASDAISDEPGRKVTCYINNHDRPGDMFSYYYMKDNYLEMRQLLLDAIELADDTDYTRQGRTYERASQKERIQFLLAGCDTLGLSANFKEWWANPDATAENKAFYQDTYAKLHAFIKMHGLTLYSENTYVLSEQVEYDKSPLHSFNGTPSWNSIDNSLTWGASDDMPDWGFHG
jgi:hypothetical protein